VLAGGQSLVPLLNMRLARPEVLIDLNRVPDLSYITAEQRDGIPGISFGAMARQRSIEEAGDMPARLPLLAEAISWVGHPQIRNRGTIGGSVAHADSAAELPLVFRALDGIATVHSTRGARTIRAQDFFLHAFTTALEPDELLTEVWLPLRQPRTGQAFLEVARRHGDFALVAVAVSLSLGADGLFKQAAELASRATEPSSDVHADARYRREVAGTLTYRALQTAFARAREGA
jgi:carbon-monoxide dehydrogenase medium subunit